MGNASGGPHVPSHIHHCLCVVILDGLDLMVPLLKRHLGLSRKGITTEGVDSGGAHPQPICKHAEEVADISISLRGTCEPLCGLTISPSTPPLRSTYLSSMLASLLPPWTLRLSQGNPCGDAIPSLSLYGDPLELPIVGHHQGPRHPWSVLSRAHHLGWHAGERPDIHPHPEHTLECQRGDCSSWQHNPSPAYCLGAGYGA